MNTSFIFIS